MAKDKKTDKPVKRPHEYSPVIGDNGLTLEKGDNSRYIQVGLSLFSADPVDITDDEAVQQRVLDYFGLCRDTDVRPTVSGLSVALGIDRRRLWEINTDNPMKLKGASVSTSDVIKKAYQMLEFMWEQYMYNGKLHPTAGVFFGVNNFGYQNTQDVKMTIAPDNPLGSTVDKADVTEYKELITDGLADDSDD